MSHHVSSECQVEGDWFKSFTQLRPLSTYPTRTTVTAKPESMHWSFQWWIGGFVLIPAAFRYQVGKILENALVSGLWETWGEHVSSHTKNEKYLSLWLSSWQTHSIGCLEPRLEPELCTDGSIWWFHSKNPQPSAQEWARLMWNLSGLVPADCFFPTCFFHPLLRTNVSLWC